MFIHNVETTKAAVRAVREAIALKADSSTGAATGLVAARLTMHFPSSFMSLIQ